MATLFRTFLAMAALAVTLATPAAHAQRASSPARADLGRARAALARIGPTFIENRGQWPRDVRFYSRSNGLDLWVTDRGVVYDLYKERHASAAEAKSLPVNAGRPDVSSAMETPPVERTGHLLRMEFVGAAKADVRGMERVPGRYNYFIGRDMTRWATDVSHYRETRLEGLYDGIAARLYFDGGRPRYDLILSPNADPSAIRVRFAGAEGTKVDSKGELVIATSMGDVAQQGLYAYQTIGGRERPVACAFTLERDGTVGFALGNYDRSKPVVIDPIVYSTYIGGSGDDNAYAMAIDASGYAYLTGYASTWQAFTDSFPTEPGSYDITYNGGTIDAFVTKLDCASDTLSYSTFIGGSSFEDARAIVLDGSRNAYVCGYTGSSDFPTTAGSYAPNYVGGPFDAFVVKLSATGSSLSYSTFIGGQYTDGAYALALTSGNALRICGYTASADFPTTAGAYDRTHNGNDDIFVCTLNSSGSSLTSSTYIGGSGTDYAYAILSDGAGNVYISGNTSSNDFPTSPGAFSTSFNGGTHDACLVRVMAGDGSLSYSTYLGGRGDDYAYGIDVGATGIVIAGYTSSNNFPTTSGAYDVTYNGGAFDAFLTKFSTQTLTPTYSTYIGGSSDDYAYDVVLDASENAYFCGNTASDSFPTTLGAYDRTHDDIAYDAYIAEMNVGGSALIYSTFIGGSEQDVANDIDLHNGQVYICGTTHSRNYPVSSNAYDDTLGKKYVDGQNIYSYDAFVTRLDLRNVALLEGNLNGLLCPTTTQSITWGSYLVGNVTIQLSSDGGVTFPTTIVASTPASAGSYAWAIPADLAPGNRYRIRIADVNDASIADTNSRNLTVLSPATFTTQPSAVQVCPGDSARLTAQATGTGLRYQWRRNGAPVPGGTGPALTVRQVNAADTGSYTLSITDSCGTVLTSSAASVTFVPELVGSSTVAQFTGCAGDTVRWSATSTGFGQVRYQWRHNGANIAGETGSTFSMVLERQDQAGAYDVVITDGCASHRLTYAGSVTLNQIPITNQPEDKRIKLGDSATFSVVTSISAVTFQWRKDGVNIPGATGATYTVHNATAADTGRYDVVLTGGCTTVSNSARLTIEGVGAVPMSPSTGVRMLLAVRPNPANGKTVVTITPPLPASHRDGAELGLYDIVGRKVLDLTPSLAAGSFAVAELDASSLPAGIYYCRLSSGTWNGPSAMVVVAK